MTATQQSTGQPPSGAGPMGAPGVRRSWDPKLGIPSLPQVNLLPSEVTEKRKVHVAQGRMVWSLIAVLVLCVLAFGAAYLVRVDSAARLDGALTTAEGLAAQKREYSPVISVIDGIEDVQTSRVFVLATEVDWSAYAYALAAVLPEDVTIDSLTVAASAAGETLIEGADPLTTAGVGIMTFSATSPTLPDASAWIDSLESIPGLASANLQSSELQDSDGGTYYQVLATVQVTTDALAWRVFDDAEAAAPAEDGE